MYLSVSENNIKIKKCGPSDVTAFKFKLKPFQMHTSGSNEESRQTFHGAHMTPPHPFTAFILIPKFSFKLFPNPLSESDCHLLVTCLNQRAKDWLQNRNVNVRLVSLCKKKVLIISYNILLLLIVTLCDG